MGWMEGEDCGFSNDKTDSDDITAFSLLGSHGGKNRAKGTNAGLRLSYSEVGSFTRGLFLICTFFGQRGNAKRTRPQNPSTHPSIQMARCLLTPTTNKTALSLCVVLGRR